MFLVHERSQERTKRLEPDGSLPLSRLNQNDVAQHIETRKTFVLLVINERLRIDCCSRPVRLVNYLLRYLVENIQSHVLNIFVSEELA